MGLPERLLDRQLAGRSGDLQERVRGVRREQWLLLVPLVLGLLTSAVNLASGSGGASRTVWAVLGILCLGYAYVLVRQWRYLNQRMG